MAKKLKEKNKGGRPKKDIDPKLVFELAHIHCTDDEIASVLGCATSTLQLRFSGVLRDGRQDGQKSLKRKMHEIAMNGDTKMLIWLSKQRLGYKDTIPEHHTHTVFNVICKDIPKPQIEHEPITIDYKEK